MLETRREEIQDNVEDLLKRCDLFSVPVDLERIVEIYGINCVCTELDDDVSGFLVVEDKNSTIVVNELHHPNRQRFTLAHELGHFFLHRKGDDQVFIDKKYAVYNRDSRSSSGVDEQEVEANVFAASLLMPEGLVLDVLESYDLIDDADTMILAKKFGVSLQALGFRLAKLGYEVGQDY